MRVKNILIPTDGSDYSKTAQDYGIYLARKLGARLTGLFIMDLKIIQDPLFDDISGFMGLSSTREIYPFIEKGMEERADSILEDFDERCKKEGIDPELKKIRGIVDEMIIEKGEDADCIILAQRGEHYSLTDGGLLGSTSESVVRKTGKPVLVTPLDFKEIRKVGLAYDGGPHAERALKIAAELSVTLESTLTVLIITGDDEEAQILGEKIGSFLDPYDVQMSLEIRSGKEEQEIVRFSGEGMVDLLVMGAYGHSRIRKFILGSTTSYVIRKSEIPVLLIR
jgi:nucleotide-binding universal stress UspA family protein